MSLRFTISLHRVGDAFTRDGDHLDWFFQADLEPTSPVMCFSTPVDVDVRGIGPSTGCLPVTHLPDHRAVYLDYDGEVSGNRGDISRWITGHFEWVLLGPPEYRLRLLCVETVVPRPATRFDGAYHRLFEQLQKSPIILLESV